MEIKKNKYPIFHFLLIGFLPSFIKKIIYRINGYKIGKNVNIGIGSIVLGKNVEIGENTKIGFLTVIRANNIILGRYVQIGFLSFIITNDIKIGDYTHVCEHVNVGGTKFNDSVLKIGKRCRISQGTYLDCGISIIIGDDTGIGPHCHLYTHGVWLSELDGFPVSFKPVILGNMVWISANVVILAGTHVGDNVIVGAGSSLSGIVPSNCILNGNPAKILSKNFLLKNNINNELRIEIINNILDDFVNYIDFYGYSSVKNYTDSGVGIDIKKENKFSEIFFLTNNNQCIANVKDNLFIIYSDLNMEKLMKECKGSMVLNVLDKTRLGISGVGDEFVKFASRYGLRFTRLD